MKRFKQIDGVRGWAALSVLFFHLSWETFGGLFPELRIPYLRFFFDGPLAVYIFFILSGDALSSGYIASKNENIIKKLIVKRYFRLLGPILLSCLIVYFLMYAGLNFNVDASRIIHSESWLGSFLPFKESLVGVFLYGTNYVFTSHQISNSYNPFLWPMGIELFGSALVFCFLLTYDKFKNPLIASTLISGYLFFLGSLYALFFIGISYCILRSRDCFLKAAQEKYSNILSASLFIIAILVDCLLSLYGGQDRSLLNASNINGATDSTVQLMISGELSPIAYIHEFIAIYKEEIKTRINIILAAIVVFAIYSNSFCISAATSKFSVWLGRISFPLYVTHFAVIISFTSWSIIELSNRGLLGLGSAMLVILLSAVIALFVADIFSRIENLYLNRLNNFVSRRF